MDTQELEVTDIIELSELGWLLVDPDTGEEDWQDWKDMVDEVLNNNN